jgi:hypothetical protein
MQLHTAKQKKAIADKLLCLLLLLLVLLLPLPLLFSEPACHPWSFLLQLLHVSD